VSGVSRRLSRILGAATGSTLALALLVCGCVFAALAGPALSLHTQTEALHQTLSGLDGTTKTLQVSSDWNSFTGEMGFASGNGAGTLSAAMIGASTAEMSRGFTRLGVPLAAGSWAGLTSKLYAVSGVAPSALQVGGVPKMEVTYRDPLAGDAQLTTGSFASTGAPPGSVAVVATTQMAARFGLRPGHSVTLQGGSGPVRLYVTGLVSQRGPGSTFWQQDVVAAAPQLNTPAGGKPYWVGGVIADPDQLGPVETIFGGLGLSMNWEYPLATGNVTADRVQGLYDVLSHATTATPALTGELLAGANTLTVTSPLLADLSQFLATQAAIETVLLLLFVSLMVVGAAVIVLAARIIVARRETELSLLRARGGSLPQVSAVMLRTAVVAAVPATAAGVVLAVALIPDGGAAASGGWPLAVIAFAAALAGPPLVAAWQHRKPVAPSNPALILSADTGAVRRPWRRVVIEVTACLAAVAGLVVLHDQGVPAGGGTDLYLAITPVLVAIPVVVVLLRLYPLVVGALLVLAARGAGATGFVALSRAARSSLTGVLPAFALVLALSLATFAGTVTNAINRGEIAASWNTTGGDVQISTSSAGSIVTPAALAALSQVRGVRHVALAWNTAWVTPFGQAITVTQVEPASYASLVADTPFPSFPAGAIGPAPGHVLSPAGTATVIASPAAAAVLGSGATQLSSLFQMGPITIHVVGTVASTPADPGGGPFVVMPLETVPGIAGQPVPGLALVTGPSIDQAQLTAVARKVIPGCIITFRSAVLASLASSPLQHGAALIIALTLITAAAFGLFILILGLALGSAERELTLARLTVMGHERSGRLVVTEAIPAVLAAIVGGAVCALVLPHLIGTSISLSAFTGTSAPVQFEPDLLAFGLPAAAILALALAALAGQTRAIRRHGIIGKLRAN
jgi:putative ABC transport system permease protein